MVTFRLGTLLGLNTSSLPPAILPENVIPRFVESDTSSLCF